MNNARWFEVGAACMAAVTLAWSSFAMAEGAKAACAGDIQKYCANVPEGGGAIAKCLRGMCLLREHCLKGLLNVAGAPVGQSGNDCGIRRKADRIPTEGGQHSDDCGQPVIAA